MQKPILFLCAALILYSCSKSGNNYSTTDHTRGMITPRQWTGKSTGYRLGDTLLPLFTVRTAWPKPFNRTIADTSLTVAKINGFAVSLLGASIEYRTTDSAMQYERFDSLLGGLAVSLYYYYVADSMSFTFDEVDSLSSAANEYYQVHDTLHTTHS